MSKWVSGKELIEQRNLKGIELFQDYVAQGLQPYDDLGQSISPLDVMKQILDVKGLKDELAEHERFTHQILDESEAQLRADRTFALGKEIESTENALKAAGGVSWADYELPSDPHQAKAVLVRLSECLFRQEDSDELEKGIKLLQEKPEFTGEATKRSYVSASAIPKAQVQETAKRLWETHGQSIPTASEMADRQEILDIAQVYQKETRRRWIAEISPDFAKRPGVRKKK